MYFFEDQVKQVKHFDLSEFSTSFLPRLKKIRGEIHTL